MRKSYQWKPLTSKTGEPVRYYLDEDDLNSTRAEDPWFMDVVEVERQWWLCQYDTTEVDASTELLGPYTTLKDAKAAAEMMYNTLVTKIK